MARSALLRYFSAMATIQIREIPEEAYEVIRRRARAAGMSIQAYMRQVVIDFASRPSKAEAIARIEALLPDESPWGDPQDIVRLIHEGRRY